MKSERNDHHSQSMHRQQIKLQRRRVTSGWWIDAYDLIPQFVVHSIKPYHNSNWQTMSYGLTMSFVIGSLTYLFVVPFLGAMVLGHGLQAQLSHQDLTWMCFMGFICLAFYLFISLAQPASQNNAVIISIVDDLQPDLIPIAAKWAAKRGFLTARDLYLLMECCQSMQQVDPHPERRGVFHYARTRWNNLREESRQKKARLREDRNAIIENSILVPHIQAIVIDTKTPGAPACSKPGGRL